MAITCYKHNVEYGYGNCPICEQENHNAALQKQAAMQTDILQKQHRLLESQVKEQREQEEERKFQEEHRQAKEEYRQAKEEHRQAKEEYEEMLIGMMKRLLQQMGEDQFSKIYLRLIISAREKIGSNILEEHTLKVLSLDINDECNKIINLQQNLFDKINKASDLVYENAEKDIKDNKERSRKKIRNLKIIYSLAIISAIIISIKYKYQSIFVSVLASSAVAYLFGKKKSDDKKQNEYRNKKLEECRDFTNQFSWYQSQRKESIDFYEEMGRRPEFAAALVRRWAKEEISKEYILDCITTDLNNLNKFSF